MLADLFLQLQGQRSENCEVAGVLSCSEHHLREDLLLLLQGAEVGTRSVVEAYVRKYGGNPGVRKEAKTLEG